MPKICKQKPSGIFKYLSNLGTRLLWKSISGFEPNAKRVSLINTVQYEKFTANDTILLNVPSKINRISISQMSELLTLLQYYIIIFLIVPQEVEHALGRKQIQQRKRMSLIYDKGKIYCYLNHHTT